MYVHGLISSMNDHRVFLCFQDKSAQLSNQAEAVGVGRMEQSDSTSR